MVRFLTLCTYEQSYPIQIEFSDNDLLDEFLANRLNKSTPKTVKCFYQNAFYKPSYNVQQWHQHLIRYSSIEDKLSSIIPLWFTKSDQLVQPIELLLQYFIDKYHFSVDRFLQIIKAVEAFHRLDPGFSNEVLSAEEFEVRKAKFISDKLSEDEKKWIRQRMENGNEPSLKKRIEELVDTYSFPYFAERIGKKSKFCRAATDCRNQYTHPNLEGHRKALKGKELFDLTENLKLLLLAAIVRSIGIPIEAIELTVRGIIY